MLLVFILPTENSISEPKPAKYANANNATASIFLKNGINQSIVKNIFVMLT